jgi:nicotinamide-nucleotide amidase
MPIMITGGLGPTNDDRTKQALADYFDDTLVMNNDVLEDIKAFILKRRGTIEMTENNRAQALVLSNSIVLRNLVGTAPSMVYNKNGTQIITMPGVPFEMKWLSENRVFPFLKESYHPKSGIYRTLHVFGLSGI